MSIGIPANFTDCPHGCGFSAGPTCPKCNQPKSGKVESSPSQVFDDAADFTEEKKLQAKAVEWLILNGAVGIVWHATNKPTTCAPGVSDIICLYRGKFIAAECKIGANKPTRAQQDYIDAVNAYGGVGFVFRSVDELRANLATIAP